MAMGSWAGSSVSALFAVLLTEAAPGIMASAATHANAVICSTRRTALAEDVRSPSTTPRKCVLQ